MVRHHEKLAFAVAAVIAACGAEPAGPPIEEGASGGSSAGTGGSTLGSSGSASTPGGSAGVSGQGGTDGAAGGFGGTAGTASGASGSTGQGGAGPTVTFAQITALIPGTCGGDLCHTGRQTPFLGNDANLHRTLLDTVVTECGGAHLVVPGDPEGSAIIWLVNRRCTKLGLPFYMPRDCESNPCLPSAQIQTITNWIQAGAPR